MFAQASQTFTIHTCIVMLNYFLSPGCQGKDERENKYINILQRECTVLSTWRVILLISIFTDDKPQVYIFLRTFIFIYLSCNISSSIIFSNPDNI